jgi:hypothetical protein
MVPKPANYSLRFGGTQVDSGGKTDFPIRKTLRSIGGKRELQKLFTSTMGKQLPGERQFVA